MSKIWKDLAIAAGAVLASCIGFFLVEVKGYVSNDEVKSLIQTESPYVQDRALIKNQIDILNKNVEKTATQLEENTKASTDLRIEIARLVERLSKDGESIRKRNDSGTADK